MKYAVLCKYEGGRPSDPLKQFKGEIIVFQSWKDARDFAEEGKIDTCESHEILPVAREE